MHFLSSPSDLGPQSPSPLNVVVGRVLRPQQPSSWFLSSFGGFVSSGVAHPRGSEYGLRPYKVPRAALVFLQIRAHASR